MTVLDLESMTQEPAPTITTTSEVVPVERGELRRMYVMEFSSPDLPVSELIAREVWLRDGEVVSRPAGAHLKPVK